MDGITMRMLITNDKRIITFSENIENLYTYIALILFVSDTLIIFKIGLGGCLGFIIVTVSIIQQKSLPLLITICEGKYTLCL